MRALMLTVNVPKSNQEVLHKISKKIERATGTNFPCLCAYADRGYAKFLPVALCSFYDRLTIRKVKMYDWCKCYLLSVYTNKIEIDWRFLALYQ